MSDPGSFDPGSVLLSWSGGKDSALVLDRLRRGGVSMSGLFTMFSPETDTSRSHGLPRGLMHAQAELLGLPLFTAEASWDDYEAVFKEAVGRQVEQGVAAIAFGDIYLEDHRKWVERVCGEIGCRALEPLWGEETGSLATEVVRRGFGVRICTVRRDRLALEWLGASFDEKFIDHVASRGIDPCGEHGEFHTVVLEGPGMAGRILIDEARRIGRSDHGHWRIDRWNVER